MKIRRECMSDTTPASGKGEIDHTPYVPSIERRVHVLVCNLLGLDDEDHEDDEEAAPLEGTIMQLIADSNQQAVQKALASLVKELDSYTAPHDKPYVGWTLDFVT